MRKPILVPYWSTWNYSIRIVSDQRSNTIRALTTDGWTTGNPRAFKLGRPDSSFTDTTVAGVVLPPETSVVVSGAGDAALPSELAARVNDGSCAALPLGAAAGDGAGAH